MISEDLRRITWTLRFSGFSQSHQVSPYKLTLLCHMKNWWKKFTSDRNLHNQKTGVLLSLSTVVTLFEPEKPGFKATLYLTHGNRAESSARV